MGEVYIWEKFYLMDTLPRNLLLSFPWFQKTGAILDARAGHLQITEYKQTIPLIRLKKEAREETVFAAFGLQNQISTAFQYNAQTPSQLLTAVRKTGAYKRYVQEEISNSVHAKQIKNVFAAKYSIV